MKTVRLLSSPSTEYEVIKETTPLAPNDQIFCVPEGVEFAKTQQQSEEYIKSLEEQLRTLRNQIDAINEILNPDMD